MICSSRLFRRRGVSRAGAVTLGVTFENSSKLFVNRAQKRTGRVGAGHAPSRGQRRRGFGHGKFEPEWKKEVGKSAKI